MGKDDARNRILDAAGPVFAEKGYRAATVREICEKADMNVASVNYYFGDKENLYVETFKRAHPVSAEEVCHPHWPPGAPATAKLKDFILTLMKRIVGVKADSWQRRLMDRERFEPTPTCREMLEKFFRREYGVLMEILDELLPADTARHKRNQIAFSIVGQCVHYAAGHPVIKMLIPGDELKEHYGPEELAEHILQVCLAALGLGPPLFHSHHVEHSTGELNDG